MAAGKVEHDIGDALPRPVIGPAAAAAGAVDRQTARVEQFLVARAGAGGIERRVLEEPDELGCRTGADRRDARLHLRDRRRVTNGGGARPPLDPGRFGAYL